MKKSEQCAYQPEELKALVLGAQQHQQPAIDELCEAFAPLVLQEAHLSYVSQALGEEAENTAWMYFLEFIMSYKDDCYMLLPGLIKVKLRFALMEKIYRSKSINALLILDAANEDGNRLFDPASEDVHLERLHLTAALKDAMHKLSSKQRQVVESTVINNMPLNEYSQKHNISYTAAYLLQKRALAALKAAF